MALNIKKHKSFVRAIENNSMYQIVKMIDNGADMNVQGMYLGTPLIYAICIERDEVAKLLIKRGCDIYLKDKHGDTALEYARIFRRKKIIKLLESKLNK